MKISEITTLLNRVKAVTYQEKFIPFDDLNCDNSMKKLNEMISTLEQLAEPCETICQAHMAGQFDAGCKHPSWSNAHAYYISNKKDVEI